MRRLLLAAIALTFGAGSSFAQPSRDAGPRRLGTFLEATTPSNAAARRLGQASPWRVSCRQRIAEDAVVCEANRAVQIGSRRELLAILLDGRTGAAGALFVFVGHDWPTASRTATVRVDQREPMRMTAAFDHYRLLGAMLNGDVLHSAFLRWPFEQTIEVSYPLAGLHEALQRLVEEARRSGLRP